MADSPSRANDRRMTLYLSERLQSVITPRMRHSDSVAGTLESVAVRYAEICRRSAPDLSWQEWSLIADALNGTWLAEEHGGYSAANALEHEIADAIRLNAADRKWKVDGAMLLGKLRGLDYAGRVAVVDAIERFWAQDDAEPEEFFGRAVRA